MAPIDLPAELVLYIVDCLIPSNPPVVFSRGHVITRTLLSLTLVCKLVSRTAKQLLIKHCLQIDSSELLDRVLQWSALSGSEGQAPHLPVSVGLFLSPFPVDNLNIPSTVYQVDRLSSVLCSNLTRLVIDMPLRYLYPEDDHEQVRPALRAAFARMTKLVEFCSVKDELYLSTVEGIREPAIWSFWPRLQRLALYNVAVDSSQFIDGLRQCLNLTHLVLVRPDGLSEEVPSEHMDLGFLPSLQRLIIVNTGADFLQSTPFDQKMWEESFVGRLHALRSPDGDADSDSETGSVASYLSLRTPFGRDDDDIEICQEWLYAQAISGALWGTSDDHPAALYLSSNSLD